MEADGPFGTFTCALCERTFPKGRSDDEAMAASVALWGEIPATDLAVICDDCFHGTEDADGLLPWAQKNGLTRPDPAP